MCIKTIKHALRFITKTVAFLAPAYTIAYLTNTIIPPSLFALLYSYGIAYASTTELHPNIPFYTLKNKGGEKNE